MTPCKTEYSIYIFNIKTCYTFLYSVFKTEKEARARMKKLAIDNPYILWLEPYNYYDL